ncbi:hypothetical protein HDV05_002423, partial [Chytridiales sp. JEL 0842]
DGDVQMDGGEDDEIARAIAMSMQSEGGSSSSANDALSSVLGNLPGVDPNDPRIKDALDGLNKKEKKDEKK